MSSRRVKVRLKLPGGTVLEIEGDEASVAKTAIEIDRKLKGTTYKTERRKSATSKERSEVVPQVRPGDALKELVEEGFFNEGRTIEDVSDALEAKGVDTSGKKRSGIALILNQWERENRFAIKKEALTEKEKLQGIKGTWRYFAPTLNK